MFNEFEVVQCGGCDRFDNEVSERFRKASECELRDCLSDYNAPIGFWMTNCVALGARIGLLFEGLPYNPRPFNAG